MNEHPKACKGRCEELYDDQGLVEFRCLDKECVYHPKYIMPDDIKKELELWDSV